MPYVRKTADEWHLEGHYGHGWELLTAEDSRREILARLKEYRDNEGGTYRVRCRRVPLAKA
jgi:hypothetical protein